MLIDQMAHFGIAGDITGQASLQLTVRLCLPLVLTQMFSP